MGGGAVPPPPRQLELRCFAGARAGELLSLHAAVSTRLAGHFSQPRSARRRTTGHLPTKRRRRRKDTALNDEEEDARSERRTAVGQSRRVRRRRELAGNPAEGFSAAGDGARRLRTHLWHAKRFSMGRRWRFVLPLGVSGRGRGSRAVLKWLKNGVVVHDASYFIPIQLDGPEDSLLSILRMVLCPSPSEKSLGSDHLSDQVVRGVCYGNAMLWHAGNPPHIVGPVTYMWRPCFRVASNSGTEEGNLPNNQTSSGEGNYNSLLRQLWIWIHPAALKEGLDVLVSACEKQMQDYGCVVKCRSLEGKIARFEVMGSKATHALKTALRPVNKVLSTGNVFTSQHSQDSSTGSHLWKASVFDHVELLQPHAILSLLAYDPREGSGLRTDSSPGVVSLNHEKELQEEVLAPNSFSDRAPAEKENVLLSMWSNPGRHDVFLSDCKELWDPSHKIDTPIPDEVLCMEKHHRRIKYFCLDSGDQQGQSTEGKDCFNQSCPIILVKHAKEGTLSTWWSIILPLSWIKPFWLFLVAHGAHAIGLRERRWIASKFKLPSFPYDYPDSKAYSSFMADENAAFDRAADCRPAAMRPPRVPLTPPWNCIMSSFHKGYNILRGLKADDMEQSTKVFPECLQENPDSGGTESSPTDAVAFFQPLVLRTIQMLRQHVNEFDEKYLISYSIMDTDTDSGGAFKVTRSVNEVCLVRVLIRAFREGSFEDGAVVCAPLPSDLSAWKTSSAEEEEESVEKWELHLPQSHVSSYFTWLDPSTSNLLLPKDDATREAFRWPIGFVTSGFVHGSSVQDAVAIAFCEPKLLAMLRWQQQTNEGLQGREICVLVRNTRSVAYRRALATVVLELQKEDLDFL